MYKSVGLTNNEKRVIRKIAGVQIKNLNDIISKNCTEDITLWALIEQIEEEELFEQINMTLDLYKNVQGNPQLFFSLPENDLCISRHILANFIEPRKYRKGITKIWKKLILMDTLPICLQ